MEENLQNSAKIEIELSENDPYSFYGPFATQSIINGRDDLSVKYWYSEDRKKNSIINNSFSSIKNTPFYNKPEELPTFFLSKQNFDHGGDDIEYHNNKYEMINLDIIRKSDNFNCSRYVSHCLLYSLLHKLGITNDHDSKFLEDFLIKFTEEFNIILGYSLELVKDNISNWEVIKKITNELNKKGKIISSVYKEEFQITNISYGWKFKFYL